MRRIHHDPVLRLGRRGGGLPAPLDAPGVSLWYGARTAIHQATRALGLGPGDRVLAPAYACGSELDALLRSGLEVALYRVAGSLEPDLDDVAARHAAAPARALYVTHHLGFAQPMAALMAFARERGLLLVEDAAQALHARDAENRPLGTLGDAGVFSLTKSLPLPDGGALWLPRERAVSARARLDRPERPARAAVAGKLRALVEGRARRAAPRATAAAKRLALDPAVAALKRRGVGAAAASGAAPAVPGSGPAPGPGCGLAPVAEPGLAPVPDYGLAPVPDYGLAPVPDYGLAPVPDYGLAPERMRWGPSALTTWLLPRLPHAAIARARRRNHARLAARAGSGGPGWWPLHPAQRPGDCPLAFAVRTPRPATLLAALEAAGIVGCYPLWSDEHPAFDWRAFPFERELKRTTVSLPVHQDLDEAAMDRIADVLDALRMARAA